jgi:hypothetical protein
VRSKCELFLSSQFKSIHFLYNLPMTLHCLDLFDYSRQYLPYQRRAFLRFNLFKYVVFLSVISFFKKFVCL